MTKWLQDTMTRLHEKTIPADVHYSQQELDDMGIVGFIDTTDEHVYVARWMKELPTHGQVDIGRYKPIYKKEPIGLDVTE